MSKSRWSVAARERMKAKKAKRRIEKAMKERSVESAQSVTQETYRTTEDKTPANTPPDVVTSDLEELRPDGTKTEAGEALLLPSPEELVAKNPGEAAPAQPITTSTTEKDDEDDEEDGHDGHEKVIYGLPPNVNQAEVEDFAAFVGQTYQSIMNGLVLEKHGKKKMSDETAYKWGLSYARWHYSREGAQPLTPGKRLLTNTVSDLTSHVDFGSFGKKTERSVDL